GVLACLVEGRPGSAERAGTDVHATPVESAHGELEALPLLADAVGGRHLAALEDDLPRRLGVPAHLLLERTERETRGALHHGEGPPGSLVRCAREEDGLE